MNRNPLAVALFVLALPSAGATAQPDAAPPGEPSLVETQLRLHATLAEIRDLLARQVEGESLRLLLERSRLASEKAERLEARLASARSELRSLEDGRSRLEAQQESMRRIAEGSQDEQEIARLDALEPQFQAEVELLRAHARELAAEIVEIENRVAAEREDAESWRSVADRRLGGL